MKRKYKLIGEDVLKNTTPYIIAMVVALALTGIILMATGYSATEGLSTAWSGIASSSYRIANVLAKVSILLLLGLSAAIPWGTGIWNVGGEGQLVLGGMTAALIGIYVQGLPSVLHILLALIGGVLAGAVWALVPAYFRVRYGVNEIVSTIMFNYIAVKFTMYLVMHPFHEPGATNIQTKLISDSAVLPQIVPMSNLSFGAYIAIAVFIFMVYLMLKTIIGYEWRILGSNFEFARYGGINERWMRMLSMAVGGALAGLTGVIYVLGVYHRFLPAMSGGLEYDGIQIATIAMNKPGPVFVLSSIFAIIQGGAIGMEGKMGISIELKDIIQSSIVFLLIIRGTIWDVLVSITRRIKKALRGKHDKDN